MNSELSYKRPVTEEETKWYKEPPPPFGHGMLKFFELDPDYVNLNHGTFGSLPRPVRAGYDALSTMIERNPDLFGRMTYYRLMNNVRRRLAEFLHAHTDEIVLLPNVAHGINTILRNIDWRKGDVLVTNNTVYDAVEHAVNYVSNSLDEQRRPQVSHFEITFPTSHAEILRNFKEHLARVSASIAERRSSDESDTPPKVVVLMETIMSQPGVLIPWRDMTRICKEFRNVLSIVDAAHSIGQETYLNLGEIDADFWVSNCNKWLYAKRGSAVLHVPFRNQYMIKDTLVPALVYPVRGLTHTKFVDKFFWAGSADVATLLSIDPALDFREYLGGEVKINEYCRKLTIEGGRLLATILATTVMDSPTVPGELIQNMVNVELPLGNLAPSVKIWHDFQAQTLEEANVFATIFYHNSRWWVRCSTQIYNEISDFEKLGTVLKRFCKAATSQ